MILLVIEIDSGKSRYAVAGIIQLKWDTMGDLIQHKKEAPRLFALLSQ